MQSLHKQRIMRTDAASPRDIPPAGWRAIAGRVWRLQSEAGLWVAAAGVAFYALLGVLPGLGVLVLTIGTTMGIAAIKERIELLADVLPRDAAMLFVDQLADMLSATGGTLGWGVAGTLGLTLWSVCLSMRALMAALNLAYGTTERRGFLHLNALALGLGLGAVTFVPLTFALYIGIPTLMGGAETGMGLHAVLRLVRWPVLAAVILLGLAVLYRVGPCRAAPKWRWVSWGALAATAAWLAASALFIAYTRHVMSYQWAYGMAGAVVTLMLWLNLIVYAIMFGAALNAQTERQTSRNTATAEDGVAGADAARPNAAVSSEGTPPTPPRPRQGGG
ncbi:YihY/virulence factor BrkB family protein [Azospirillum sp.]|uniref:YihY/virulence factor BrkB family protein n=1 Tax=Azospirillum sp. TaxID=34012 RepID=UPI002D6D2C43|nr:YihY/virulence factor BrkB family protein [Azospirillum sp.]HYD70270.1 YihY/virulence factor BrkB family protein [Azospirillum sp.]